MKSLLLAIIFGLGFYNSFPQSFSGYLVNADSRQPVAYANIGIIGKDVGTVSDNAGWFRIELDSHFDNDTLCISCIGYISRKYLIGEFKRNMTDTSQVKIELPPRIYTLHEVIVKPAIISTYTLGYFCEAESTYGNAFYSEELGTEVGVMIRLPRNRDKAYLKSFRFYVGEFTFDHFPVRLNVYNLKNDVPSENILTEPVFIGITSPGEYIIDLKKNNIVTDGDFFISLEYYRIPDEKVGKLVFCAVHQRKITRNAGFYRFTSHGNWIPEFGDTIGFSVEVECEK